MVLCKIAYRIIRGVFLAMGTIVLAGCTYEQEGPPGLHFKHFKTSAPANDVVTVCSAYGCQHQASFTFTPNDIRQISILMEAAHRENTAKAERKALGETIAWIERRVGPVTGTDRDRPGLDLMGSGDRHQQDCVDEATNTTSYMLVMERYGMLRHHTVVRPMAKGNMILGKWPHWGAMIEERATGQKYAVDSFFYANGKPPVIMLADRWYIDDGTAITPRSSTAYANLPAPMPQPMARGELDRLMQRVVGENMPPRPAAFGYAK